MENFGLFVGNVASHWVFLMGGLAGVILAIIGEVKVKPWKNGFWTLGLICLLASCDRAWQDEHRNTVTVMADKAQIAAAYEECHTSAKVRDAYTLGLEKNSLSSRETIDRQQGMSDKQANDLSSCLLTVSKMNPVVRDKIAVVIVDLVPLAPDGKGFVFIITTSEPRVGFHGYLKCSSNFEAIGVPYLPTSTSTAIGSMSPVKLSDSEYELKVSIPGADWSPNAPALMKAYSTGQGPRDCEFKPI